MPYDEPRDDHDRGIPDYRGLASQIGHSLAANGPNIIAPNGRAFWKLTDADSGALAWLAFTPELPVLAPASRGYA
ncbi:hypothetical protein [Mycobacterium sp. ST-F2]|uniref:hypothetical protein n=1 Tax=Mycobacterium sp. ST-F2 TaxID=1490484 RepID=UPI001151ED47|nr:hypothetical protein [Mycobacterium sp. ST-F2]